MMNRRAVDDVSARRFLLGELSPEARAEIEEQAFLNRDDFALVKAAEDDLIDEFLSGDLSPDEQMRFAEYFLLRPGRSEDVRIAAALKKYVSQNAASARGYVKEVANVREKHSLLRWLNS